VDALKYDKNKKSTNINKFCTIIKCRREEHEI